MSRELFLTPPNSRNQNFNIRSDKPCYRILNEPGFFGDDDALHPTGSLIYLEGEPNEEMEPMNDMARDNMLAYLQKLDDLAEEVSKQTGKRFAGRRPNIEEAMNDLREDNRRMELVKGDGGVPIMGAKNKRTKISRVGDVETPDRSAVKKKSSVEAI